MSGERYEEMYRARTMLDERSLDGVEAHITASAYHSGSGLKELVSGGMVISLGGEQVTFWTDVDLSDEKERREGLQRLANFREAVVRYCDAAMANIAYPKGGGV